jgi:hypothetical protein
MAGGIRVETNRKSNTLTTSPVLQSQTIKTLPAEVETKIINLEAVMFVHKTSKPSPFMSATHEMTLFSGRW